MLEISTMMVLFLGFVFIIFVGYKSLVSMLDKKLDKNLALKKENEEFEARIKFLEGEINCLRHERQALMDKAYPRTVIFPKPESLH